MAYNWRGTWSASTAYAINDAVVSGGSYWFATAASANVPPSSALGSPWSAANFPISFKGPYLASATYAAGDSVRYGSTVAVLIVAASSGVDPVANTGGVWQLLYSTTGTAVTLTFYGTWLATAAYPVNAVVVDGGFVWQCLVANTNSEPSAANGNWAALGQTGVGGAASTVSGTVLSIATSIAALRAFNVTTIPLALQSNFAIQVLGYRAAGDDGGGVFYWAPTSAADDDAGMTIRPTSLPASLNGLGRWVRMTDGRVNPEWFGASPTQSSAVNLAAFQAASRYLFARGGGEFIVPPKTFPMALTTPWIIGSNTRLIGVPGASILVPDMATIVNTSSLAWPAAAGALLMTGNPVTGIRAGITHTNAAGAQYVDPATIASNVHVLGLTIDNSGYAGPVLTGTQTCHGIAIIFCHGGSVRDCRVVGMVSDGINVAWGRTMLVDGNTCEYNGYWAPYPSSCNGISSSGWFDQVSAANSSYGLIITNNFSNYNRDEGIQHGLWQGTLIKGNYLVGNTDKGIEGDSGLASTAQSTTYGQIIPGDCIIEGNYIDGTLSPTAPYAPRNTTGLMGIGADDANQSHWIIRGNIIRNFVSTTAYTASAITCSQLNNLNVIIDGNIIEGITCASGQASAIVAIGQRIKITNNDVRGCDASTYAISVYGPDAEDVEIRNNRADTCFNFALVQLGQQNWGQGVLPSLVIEANVTNQIAREALNIWWNGPVTSRAVRIANNIFERCNFKGAASTIIGLSVLSGVSPNPTIQEFLVIENRFTTNIGVASLFGQPSGGEPAMPSGAITKAIVRNNSIGPAICTPATLAANMAIFTILDQVNNQLPGQISIPGTAAPTAGIWAVNDQVVNTAPVSGGYMGWVCVTAGTPGIWKGFGGIAA